jgi:hypothetical protein
MPAPTRTVTAVAMAICGGLAVLYLFVALIGSVDVTRAAVASSIAVGLGVVWLVGAITRARTGATRVQRHDRERRGF